MVKVITYGTFDMLHYGHIRLLERAKALGDYLIVGVTSDDYDKARGKINVKQPLIERIEAVKQLKIADEIIIEEYEGQKIDDILKYDIDVFTVGTDWVGQFDYLNRYCKVVYLERTEGVSSSGLRSEQHKVKIGIVGGFETRALRKYYNECNYVNGIQFVGICAEHGLNEPYFNEENMFVTSDFNEFLKRCDGIYILSHPTEHYTQIRTALENNVHILCESPVVLDEKQYAELRAMAEKKHLILMESIKTAYSTAYRRLLLLAGSNKIGDIISVDATCTSIQDIGNIDYSWNSICSWGPTALLPVFQILGTDYKEMSIASRLYDKYFDLFTRISFLYPNGVAEVKVGRGVKSEGELVISGTKGYMYVPAPWWKTEYFEIRYENASDNRRYFYQLEGEGIRYELVRFIRAIAENKEDTSINTKITTAICKVMRTFYEMNDVKII